MGKIRLARSLMVDSIVDGDGLRTVIWTQGCKHKCPFCHNPQTHDFNGGFDYDIDELVKEIKQVKLQSGITLSGGEPFEQVDALVELLDKLDGSMNVWCYSGYRYEQILNDPHKMKLLSRIDVLVDGLFIWSQRDFTLKYRGSKNQRIIEVKTGKLLYEGE